MNMYRVLKIHVVYLVSCLWVTAALAQNATVYKSVDDNGVVSFSDSPPESGEQAEQLIIKTTPAKPDGEYQQNLEAMRETTDKMAQDRREREEHRAKLKQLQANTVQPTSPEPEQVYTDYYPVYGNANYRPWRPQYPRPPVVRPPHRPGVQPPTSGVRPSHQNSQLMRPILSR